MMWFLAGMYATVPLVFVAAWACDRIGYKRGYKTGQRDAQQ